MNLFTDNDVMSSPAETDLPAINVHLISFAVFLHVSPTLIGDTTAACVMPPTFGSFTGRPASTLSRWYFYTMGPLTL